MSTTTYLSAVIYDNTGGGFGGATTDWPFSFPYLDRSHIRVFRDATPVSAWEFVDATTIHLATPLAAGEKLVIRRRTPVDARVVDFHNGSNLTEDDLNDVTKQLLYLIQEIADERAALDDGDGSGGLPDGGGADPDFIDTVVEEILQRQTFLNLIELIPLLDVNAEAVMGEILTNHKDWTLEHQLDDLLAKLDIKVSGQGAQLVSLTNFIEEEGFAEGETFTALVARVAEAEAAIIANDLVRATEDTALAEAIDLVSASVEGNLATIGTIQTAQAGLESAQAALTTEVAARLRTADLDATLAVSSYIQGIEASVDSDGARIEGIESFLVGVNGDFGDPDNGSFADIVSGLQTTVTGHADSLNTGIAWRQAMASRFGVPNADDGAAIAAAMVSEWETYADQSSASASQIETIQANLRPVWFTIDAPDPTDPAYNGANPDWATEGFPTGSQWFERVSPGTPDKRWSLRPWAWVRGTMSSDSVTEAIIFRRNSDNNVIGQWIPASDETIIEDFEDFTDAVQQTVTNQTAIIVDARETLVGETGSYADLRTTLQATYGTDITNVQEWLEAYIKPPEGPDEGGIMYSGWGVRMNQYVDGMPVIAGVGLGVQHDPWNPESESRSDFIVMADTFSVIAPPSNNDFIDGVLDPADVIVPFVIDTATQTVGINGDLIVRGSLKAYAGGLKDIAIGRATFGQLDSDLDLVDPSGFRMHLLSSTENYWSSNQASPFPGGSNPQKFLMWAGDGTMNHNNATFYIDTDGNAFFGGQVQAENIDGDLSTATAVNVSGTAAANNSTWKDVGSYAELSSSTVRGRKPFAMLNVAMDTSAGEGTEAEVRMMMSYETSPSNWSSYQQVAHVITGVDDPATYVAVAGGLSTTTYHKTRVKIQVRGHGGHTAATASGYSGVLFALS